MKQENKNIYVFYDEIYYRCNSAIYCLETFKYIKNKKSIEQQIRDTLVYSLLRTAIIELTSILDSSSTYSIKIYKNKKLNLTEAETIKKLCRNLNNTEVKDKESLIYNIINC